jgi:hypothetical protein
VDKNESEFEEYEIDENDVRNWCQTGKESDVLVLVLLYYTVLDLLNYLS